MNLNLNGMVSMWKMRELVDKATNIVMNYTETEAKVIKIFKEVKVFQVPPVVVTELSMLALRMLSRKAHSKA